LVRFGFVTDYIVWTFHDEKAYASGGASGGNSLKMTAVPVNANPVGEPASSSVGASNNDDGARDYITIEDILQDMADNDDDGRDGQEATLMEPEDMELFEGLANHLGENDVLFGDPRWLENFREMKQATVNPLY
jgi:hypothetical protein